ncbi:lanthionine synthetase C family protein [Actinoallomurus rhizosphaericola]|uniref:lanthionine synthetase C family protein n=1 Tax=Actinoallomurus rhizosphaericola TaxID=2952536 RepID=UPI00209278A2|nr:lanthionine synthetase C family protein [Actinoallomurus rhizosphaericola]MCO5998436.1 lanthionine synthetase C family protein [Actinoallomurus rhizosphaericola]
MKSWQVFLGSDLQHKAQRVAKDVAERLADPKVIEAALESAEAPPLWKPQALACGYASLVIAFEQMHRCFPHEGWDGFAKGYLKAAANATREKAIADPGLHEGIAGMILATSYVSASDHRYQRIVNSLLRQLATRIKLTQWERSEPGVSFYEYDVINGASGIIGLLNFGDTAVEEASWASDRLTSYLLNLIDGPKLSGVYPWHIPQRLLPQIHVYREQYPGGYYDLGVAHGMAGVISAVALAFAPEQLATGITQPLMKLCDWLLAQAEFDEFGPNWPRGVHLNSAADQPATGMSALAPTTWCYGAPGIARSLWLAGVALRNQELEETSRTIFAAALRRSQADGHRQLTAGLCHGLAGLITIACRFAQDGENAANLESIEELVERLLERNHPDAPFGFRDDLGAEGVFDDPGLLNGAAGVLLALLAASAPVEPRWDRILMLN